MSSLKVYCDGLENNPHCVHGPTLLFSRQVKGKERTFFACSAYRNRKDCSFFLWEDDKVSKSKFRKDKECEAVSNVNHMEIYYKLRDFKLLPLRNRKFCHTCFTFVIPSDRHSHDNHLVSDKISNKLLRYPSLLIEPIKSSKKEAQFWFSERSKQFIIHSFKSLELKACLCIGVPTVHELLRQTDINTLLLDIDKRYYCFYSEDEFCWFNMFNCYFMGNTEICQKVIKRFLSHSSIGIIIDPPFGARIEPLANTLSLLQQQASSELKIFLILPYFMETCVIKYFPNFEMLDYQIQYSNHNKFQNKKKPSPVRIFTNVSPSLVKMPESDGYYYCKYCNCWRSKNNRHCELCKTCPSKNGDFYLHCHKCLKCVKKTLIHCSECNRCVLTNHACYLKKKKI